MEILRGIYNCILSPCPVIVHIRNQIMRKYNFSISLWYSVFWLKSLYSAAAMILQWLNLWGELCVINLDISWKNACNLNNIHNYWLINNLDWLYLLENNESQLFRRWLPGNSHNYYPIFSFNYRKGFSCLSIVGFLSI